jgi:hypothetical protein
MYNIEYFQTRDQQYTIFSDSGSTIYNYYLYMNTPGRYGSHGEKNTRLNMYKGLPAI